MRPLPIAARAALIALVVASATVPPAPADEAPAAPAPPARPCAGPEFRQFDFWVGSWDLVSRRRLAPDQEALAADPGTARDHVEVALDGCVLVQHWGSGTTGLGLTGMSLSMYDPALPGWRQLWVDDQGSWIEFRGGLEDGRMVLRTERTVGGQPLVLRQVFTVVNPDSLDWSWERSADGGKTWRPNWQLSYRRRAAD
jgi:hypothetical protein